MPVTLAVIGVVMAILRFAEGRARLLEPPMRSSYWREGTIPNAPVNFDDEVLNCGGFDVQWQQGNGGKCGACGDPFGTFPENQYPGKYSQFPPQRIFTSGTFVNATVYSRPNMLGWFEFRLCPRKDTANVTALQECFDANVLQIQETGMTRFYPGSVGGYSDMHVLLPPGLSCDHCILQWKYNTGYRMDSTSTCPDCLGCGPQEQFVNCADIRIVPVNGTTTIPTTTTTPAPTTTTTTTTPPPAVVTTSSAVTNSTPRVFETCAPNSNIVHCEAKGFDRLAPERGRWCLENCRSGMCRELLCSCFCDYINFKIKINVSVFNRVTASPSSPMNGQSSTTEKKLCYMPKKAWIRTPGLVGWCRTYCPGKLCSTMCELSLC